MYWASNPLYIHTQCKANATPMAAIAIAAQ